MSDTVKIQIECKYVVVEKDRHGNVRYYYRRGKGQRVRLRSAPNTLEFEAECRAAAEAKPAGDHTAARLQRPRPGTYRWLCVQYFGSADFKRLDPRTQYTRRGILEHTFDEPISPTDSTPFAEFPLERMTAKAIRVLRDRKTGLPEAANNRVRCIRRVFAWGLENDHVSTNPARDVTYVRNASEGHHTWTHEEVAQFEARHPIGSKARLALDLLLMTGLRRSDVVLLGRQHVREGWIKLVLHKGRKRKPVTLELPVLPALQAALETGPAGNLTFLVTEYGKPFTAAGFGNWFRDRCNEAGLPQCSAHGLRKAAASVAAERGATVHQLMALFGWLTMRQAEAYTRQASRRQMAGDAAALMMPKKGTNAPHF